MDFLLLFMKDKEIETNSKVGSDFYLPSQSPLLFQTKLCRQKTNGSCGLILSLE